VIGWGALREGGSSPNRLYGVNVPIVARATCNNNYDGGILSSMICGGLAAGGRDSCQGDSGAASPLRVRPSTPSP
jgi:trypsin